MAVMTYMEASRQALLEEMRRDPRVWAVGEDLGRGGVFGQYKGLLDEFGAARIADAPISEACIMGAATGAAMMGSRPVVEMRFSDFALCATDELVNQAAKARYMFGGQTRVPLVVRQPIGKARVARPGSDVTLVTWSATVHVALQAAEQLSRSGIEVEVIDLRTLWPWDKDTVMQSVARTRRLLVAHEAVSVAGFGAEIVASVCENLHGALLAPPKRVAAPRIHIGYAPTLEDQVRVTPQRLVDAASRLMQPSMEEIE